MDVEAKLIAYDAGDFWVYPGANGYECRCNTLTHSVTDSIYPLDADGLSLAIARCNYLSKTLE
jgi:hypothetical protein